MAKNRKIIKNTNNYNKINKMNSEWWEIFFNGTFDKFKQTLKIIIILSLISRIIICLIVSFEVGSQAHHLELLSIKILMLFILEKIKKKSIMFKKILLYAAIEILNFVYKYFSFSAHQDEYVMYCILSTVYSVLFQTSIFQNSSHTGIIVFKHIYL